MNTRTAIVPGFRRLLAGLTGAVLTLSLHAQPGLTAQALAQWTTTNGVQSSTTSPGEILLPVGGEISRTLDADMIALHLRSQPFFSSAPEGWPAVEIGPASLIFLRDQSGGGMVLAGNQLLLLPFTVALGADGRSEKPLDITFSYNRIANAGTLRFDGSTYDVPADPTDSGPVRIAVFSGKVASWTLESLELTATGVATENGADASGGVNRATNAHAQAALPAANRGASRKQANDLAKRLFDAGDDDAAERALTGQNLNPKGTPEWHIESANALVQMAFSLARTGQPEKSARIARRALLHTRFAIQKTTEPGVAAVAEQTAGFIQERFLANMTEAKARYQSAVQKLPGSVAQRSLDRLGKSEEESIRKQGIRGR